MHEIGHILGFPHEFHWAPEPCGSHTIEEFDYTERQLTSYDDESVMNYLIGSCAMSADDWSISELDGIGARSVYGMPASWYVTVL
jgi:hypothetical protein